MQSWASHSREKQKNPCLVCKLSSSLGMVFIRFCFKNHTIPAPYSAGDCNPTHLLPNSVFSEWDIYSSIISINPWELRHLLSSTCFQKLYLLQDLSGTWRLGIAWLFPGLWHRLSTIHTLPSLPGAHICRFLQLRACCGCDTPWGASCPFVMAVKCPLIAVNLFTKGREIPFIADASKRH